MKKGYWLCLCGLILLWLIKSADCAILPIWNDERAYRPIPLSFIHGMNSSPEAWGFAIDPETEDVVLYFGTAVELRKYFDEYLKYNPVTGELLPYLEPFNYQYNTFDAVEWNAYEGYDNSDFQYHDDRISSLMRDKRPTLRRYIHKPPDLLLDPLGGILAKYQTNKLQLVAHSLGGVVSRYYINKTQGANVKQLTTLGTPHKGTLSATLADIVVINPVTDPFRWSIIWRVLFIRIFDDLDVNRRPDMIYELKPTSQFIANLNSSIPSIMRYYCIGGTIRALPLVPILFDTDAFIELHSALASRGNIPLEIPADYQPGSILPNYKGKILVPNIVNLYEYKHTVLPEKWEEILKAIDGVKPVIELTDIKNSQNVVLWRVGQWPDYFEVPQDGRLKVHGSCRKEYLPADTSINIGFRKAGQIDVNWITESGGLTTDQAQARQWLLQPSDLWRASDTNSPVAEFEGEINFPLQEITHSIVVEATNPAGIKSDPVEVSEKTHYVYAVGKDEDDGAKFLCLDGPTSFADGVGAVVSEFDLVDEEGNKMSARPLDIATDSRTIGTTVWTSNIWVSFDNRRIYGYDINTMKPNQLAGGQYYYTTTATPDGLYYDGGSLQYCSSSDNRIYRINLTNEVETNLGVVSRRLSYDGMPGSVIHQSPGSLRFYTDHEYMGYNSTGISKDYLCSDSLSKISKRDTGVGQNFIRTIPGSLKSAIYPTTYVSIYNNDIVFAYLWIDEQTTPAPVAGIAEVTDYSVPESNVAYLSCTDGNIYKVRFTSKTANSTVSTLLNTWTAVRRDTLTPPYIVNRDYKPHRYYFPPSSETARLYSKITPPVSFIEAYVIHKGRFDDVRYRWTGTEWDVDFNPNPVEPTTYTLCSFDENWTPEEQFNNPVLSEQLLVQPYDGSQLSVYTNLSPSVRVVNITDKIPNTTFYYTGRYGNESQIPVESGVTVAFWANYPWLSWYPWTGYEGDRYSTVITHLWSFLTDNGSLETLSQFRTSIPIAEGIATGPRVKIRIEPEFLLLNVGISREFKVNGKGPYIWESSDETVAQIEGTIPQINGVGEVVSIKAVGIGVATITARDALGNIAYANVDVRE